MTYEVQELGCLVDTDPRTGEPKVTLCFSEGKDEFILTLSPSDATELAALIRNLADEARQQPLPSNR
jgi:hypothetical protein